ncbi:hypothetical protein ACOMHN_052995 [Nucella lapillus]
MWGIYQQIWTYLILFSESVMVMHPQRERQGGLSREGGRGSVVMVIVLLQLILWSPADVLSRPADEWNAQAWKSLQEALRLRHNAGQAKNVIVFLGDGMGVSTVTAARIYKGQREGGSGEETHLHFETFPHVALSKTYNVDRQTADSAGTATAFLCGVKANYGTLGLDSSVLRQHCHNMDQGSVTSILQWFHDAGLDFSVRRQHCHNIDQGSVTFILQWFHDAGRSTGLVTTSRVTHATPSALYAHTPERYWESDVDMEPASDLCKAKVKDITRQLVEDNSFIKVILGGGRRTFLPNDTLHPDTLKAEEKKGRRDSRNLIQEWQMLKPANSQARYVWNRQQLNSVDDASTDYLLGLFTPSNMQYDLKRDPNKEPSLVEMVRKAINILRKDPKGFFLLVEGARIDHGHHDNYAKLALSDTVAMDDAVAVAMEMTGEDTLMVVTADHSHVFNIAGYPQRGNDIFGVVEPVAESEAPSDGMPYATLVYANGPGPARRNLTNVDTGSLDHQQSVAVGMRWETHGGEDVAIYGRGPMAHLFHGVHEQNYIAHVMAYAACVGPYTQDCQRADGSRDHVSPSACDGGTTNQSARVSLLALFFLSAMLVLVVTGTV